MVPKKVAAIHDIAGFGRSSLTVVIPVMSVLGHQTCPVPTAVLSTITGFYKDYVFEDLTNILPRYLQHWEKEQVKCDCVYSGFLGSAKQAEIACRYIDELKAPLVVVDPVFADDGKIYACFGEDILKSMHTLIKKADIITPNATEATMLLNEDTCPTSPAMAKEYAKRLAFEADCSVIITSVPDGDNVSVVIYNKATGVTSKIDNPYVNIHYPGTGDLFTAVLTASLLCGKNMEDSAAKAADFVFMCVKTAYDNCVPLREGVPLELLVPRLLEDHRLGIKKI